MTLIEKDPIDHAFHSLIDRRIFKYDVRRFASQLQGQALVRPGNGSLNQFAHIGRSGERDLIYIRMIHQRSTGFSGTRDDINHSRRKISFLQDLRQFQRC